MRPQTIIADLGASDTILYSRNLPRGKGVRINTLNGNKHGVYQHDVKLAVRSCNGDIIQLKFETVIITNSPINLLSLPQMSANGWDISMRDCTLYHPEDKHCIQLDVIDNLFHIRILHNYAAADPIHSITIHHYHADQLTKPLSRPQIDHLLFILSKPTWGGESNSRKRKHSDGVTSQKRLRSTAAGYTSATSKHFNADRYDGNLSIGVQRALPY